jgi:hypothetical protein
MCDDRGEISFLFGPWGAVDRAEAIRQIESGERRYVLQRPNGGRSVLRIVDLGDSRALSASDSADDRYGVSRSVRIGA